MDYIRFLFIYAIFSLSPLLTLAQAIRLEGKVDDQYAIVIELQKDAAGNYFGRYAYKSTLKDKGDVPSSYLYIKAGDSPYSNWVVRDSEGAVKEHWLSVNFADRQNLIVRMKNTRGRYCDIDASVANGKRPLTAYFRNHLGDYVGETGIFEESRVESRLQKMMGLLNFAGMKKIYQTETPIEYRNGMYWAYGFEAHNCCDPMAVWAYDTRSNNFYVWVRREGNNYWWSESGNVAFEFRELVETEF